MSNEILDEMKLQGWLAEPHTPEAVKQRATERLSQSHDRGRWLRPTLAAGTVLALSIGGLVVAPLVLKPRVAFAQVESALTQVKRLQWREVYSSYGRHGHLYERLVTDHYARFEPAAWDSRPRPELTYVDKKKYIGDWPDQSLRTPEETRFYNAHTKAHRITPGLGHLGLTAMIRGKILAPDQHPTATGQGWSTSNDTLHGKHVVRLESQFQPATGNPGAITHVFWVDPTSHRIVRSLFRQEATSDSNDDETIEIVCEDFRYDNNVNLPPNAFSLNQMH